ncbi:hypothetical protein ILYODFUR_010542 [Ilyodon furcidens]|uniref:Uncharacterized protein n=1 Tax=Ilyodon furcidens TaxID=33524 RepID=A0ABV0UFF3_9TELE
MQDNCLKIGKYFNTICGHLFFTDRTFRPVAQTVGNRWVAGSDPQFVCFSRCVLGQDTSPSLPSDAGQRARWRQLHGSLASVSLPHGSCGYNVAYHCQCVNGLVDD